MIGILLNMGRHTISRAIETIDHAQQDWSALYRLFERNRVNLKIIQTMIRQHVQEHNGTAEPLVAFIDDTVLRKRGRKVHGTSWKLDPLGPKFSNNFIWAQRYMQISLAQKQEPGHCRGIPILFQHCPVPEKPGKNASPELWQEYKRLQKKMRLPQRASEAVSKLQECAVDRKLIVVADGGYTNQTVCRSIVGEHVYIGRMRKDAKLFASPCEQNSGKGRKKYYGDQLPTPEEIRQTATDWSEVTACTGNGMHTFRIIAVAPVRSKVTGDRNVKVIIIQPLRYRLTSHSPLLYRNAAYLLCTDPDMPNEKILQYYLWRWEIELNFKDEKSILGIHQAQVRTPNSVESFPGFVAAAYSLFLLAASDQASQYPKWRAPKTVWRTSTNMMLANFRIDALTANKSGFTHQGPLEAKPLLFNLSWKNVIQAAAN